jgi:hypothetical protein
MSHSVASRSLQRHLLKGLCGLCLATILWPLVRPPQPPLPLLPDIQTLPGDWSASSQSSATPPVAFAPAHRFHPLGSKVALGSSITLVNTNGQWLRLTPFSSWTQSSFSLDVVKDLHPKLSEATEQRCLTRKGNIGRVELHKLMGWNDKPLTRMRRYWHIIVPLMNRSYSCIVITTNDSKLFDKSSKSSQLFSYLTKSVIWPDPPGLSKRVLHENE